MNYHTLELGSWNVLRLLVFFASFFSLPLATPPSSLFAGMQDFRSGSHNVTDEKRERDTVSRESNKEKQGAAEEQTEREKDFE